MHDDPGIDDYDIGEEQRKPIAERAWNLGKFVTKDSGEKAVHSDGVQRDTQAGKTKFTLLFPRGVAMKDQLVTRIAELYTRGGEKYGDRNWENSCAPDTLDHHLDALWRHFMSFFFEENTEEDHAAAIFWNINAVELTRRNIRKFEEAKEVNKQQIEETLGLQDDPATDKSEETYVAVDMLGIPRVNGTPILALKDQDGDYWKPNSDGTFNCWAQGLRPTDPGAKNHAFVTSFYGPLEYITTATQYEEFPWD